MRPPTVLPAPPALNHRILFDCTEAVGAGTTIGIRRAVRSIVAAALHSMPGGVEGVAVIYDGRYFTPLRVPLVPAAARNVAAAPLRERLRVALTRAHRRSWLRATVLHPSILGASRQLLVSLRWRLARMRRRAATSGARIEFQPGDWLVLMGATWGPDLVSELDRAHAARAHVCVVIYDLIQIHHAELASPGAGAIYRRWFERTVPRADRLMTISRAVRDDLLRYIRDDPRYARHGEATVGWFHLGGDMDRGVDDVPSAALAALFAPGHPPTFLMVGTLEPRKDHAVVLDAFEARWRTGDTARLVLVGREGWGSHAVTQRLARHPEFGARLHWLDAASDADLAYCYRHACALVIASISEGFGLPIAEAMRRGIPVIASDIPVFREVGGSSITYFPPRDAAALARVVATAERTLVRREEGSRTGTLTWRESALGLIHQLVDSDTSHSPQADRGGAAPWPP